MNKLNVFRILFIIGIIVMGTAVFIDSSKVAFLSQLKSGEKRLQMDLEKRYEVQAPDRPLDESQYTIAPEVPASDATPEQKAEYEKVKKDYDDKVKALKEKYEAQLKTYEASYRDYLRKQREMSMKKSLESRDNKKAADDLSRKIQDSQLSVNEFVLSSILRFIGTLILLVGSLGLLVLAENYEKLGVLILLGFGLKTIIGL
jgi:predicted HicB family RNase H-like nuclease